MEEKLYSVYDLQLNKIDIHDFKSIESASDKIREFADVSKGKYSDDEMFREWEFVLFEHERELGSLYELPFFLDQHMNLSFLKENVKGFKIIYPSDYEMEYEIVNKPIL